MSSESSANFGSTATTVHAPAPTRKAHRPSFSSSVTADRLRESERWAPLQARTNSIPNTSTSGGGSGNRGRQSVFKETGLEDHEIADLTGLSTARHSTLSPAYLAGRETKSSGKPGAEVALDQQPWYTRLAATARPMIKTSTSAPPATFSSLPRMAILAFLIAIVLPGIRHPGAGYWNANVPADGVGAGPIRGAEFLHGERGLDERADGANSVCTRWSHQSAVVNGTMYIYGGEAKTTAKQASDTWNNNFLTLDLTKSWQIGSPIITSLPQPSGPPAVANGYLWNSFTSLFLYGGLFSDTPPQSPTPFSLWEYSLVSKSWIEHASPKTAAGNNSDPGGVVVQRSAEGAGLSVPELGLSWYFGGHQDMYTTSGWSNQVARIYLRSLLEFTHPGFRNDGVQGLGNGAGSDGAFRNITQGGVQDEAGFTERADGVLVYIPGWGKQGILLGLAGGTDQQTFTEMNLIDIYDIATSTWSKQATAGPSPPIRVNPCAAVFAAADASSFNVYMYGGQNLQPYRGQTQYSDLWILTVPSFTWIQADLTGQAAPYPRAGHTCHAWDGQMVVVGGYVGTQISCDSPGISVFNASSLKWQNGYTALSGGGDLDLQEAQASQASQASSGGTFAPLQGSYGYLVPPAILSIIGGSPLGAATATSPIASPATSGPIATGHPPVFTITQSGSTIVQTGVSTSTATSAASPGNGTSSGANSAPNLGAIIAGSIAGVLALLAAYLAFCTWLYRRQLKLYKDHVAMTQRAALGYSTSPDNRNEKAGGPLLGAFGTEIGRVGSGSAGRSSESGVDGGVGAAGGAMGRGRSGRNDSNSTGNAPTGNGGVVPGWSGGNNSSSDRVSIGSSTEDLLDGQEPSFISVVLSPRRTLRVINRD